MATNHTENYSLNLWEANDKFVREEFNENTSKLDAALTNKLGRGTLLKTVHNPANSAILRIPTEDIDWDQWEYIAIHGNVMGSGSSQLHVYLSDDVSTNISFYVRPFIIVLFPRHDGSRNVEMLVLAYNTFAWWSNTTYSETTNVRISGSAITGDVEVYGI